MDELQNDLEPRGLSRRTVVAGAAWAVPVIAVASAVPMVAASPGTATLNAGTGGSIVADGNSGEAHGTLNGQLILGNVSGGPWETGPITIKYTLTGPWTTASLTDASGNPFTVNQTISANGVLWTVSAVTAKSVTFTAASQSISADTTIIGPSAKYSGTFDPDTIDGDNPITASVSVKADNVNHGGAVGSSNFYPA